MNRYHRLVDGIETNRWTDETGDKSYTEPGWEKQKYTVTVEDITAELKIKADRKLAREVAVKYLQVFDAEKYDPADAGELIEAMLIVQGIK